jgi:hypothetical protein
MRDVDAGGAADEVPVQEEQVADLADHDGGDGVVVAGQAEAGPTHQQRGEAAGRGADEGPKLGETWPFT